MPEVEQEIGREGVWRVKRLLENSTRFTLPYDAYKSPGKVTLTMLTGVNETYDLNGEHLDENGYEVTRIYVESKAQKNAGSQGREFERFLAQAYSATKLLRDTMGDKNDPEHKFLWATECPWKGDGFTELITVESVRAAVEKERDRDETKKLGDKIVKKVIPGGHPIDEAVINLVVDRTWVWVISARSEEMTPGRYVRGLVFAHRDSNDSRVAA